MEVAFNTLGLIGAGNMGQALLRGMLTGTELRAAQVRITDQDPAAVQRCTEALGVEAAKDNAELAGWADILLLAVKPQSLGAVLQQCRPALQPGARVVSVAAGVRLATLEQALPSGTRVLRAMPNVAALCGASASAICAGTHASADDVQTCVGLLSACGSCDVVTEPQMDAVTGLAGSGPAYILTIVEALADAGVLNGLPRPTALALATQVTLGAAQLLRETQLHPGVLRDRVTSPGGTTAAGLEALERGGLRYTVGQAVSAATARAQALGAGPT